MKCANHLDKDAVVVCNACGKSICPDCQVQITNENYCKGCAAAKSGQAAMPQQHSPALALILSFIISGLGQFYNGQPGKGVLIFLTSWLIIPWIIGLFDAYNTAKKIKEGKLSGKPKTGCLVAFIIGVMVSMFAFFMLVMAAAIAIPNLMKAKENADKSASGAAQAPAELNVTESNSD